MEQFDMNGPHGRGMIRIDPKTGKPLVSDVVKEPTMAEALRSYAGATKAGRDMRSTHEKIEGETR